MNMNNIRQLAILSALMCLLATSAYAAQMTVEPAYQEVFKGDNITINITVDPEESTVYAASYTLHFNNTILNATSQTQGPFLRQDGQGSAVPWNVIDNLNGTVEYSEYRQGTEDGVGNPGVLATITFQVIGDEGISGLNISDYNGELLYSSSPPGSIPTDINNGNVEVSKGICGDVNDNGAVNMDDVMDLWYHVANYPSPSEAPEIQNAWAADVDCNNNLNMDDVMDLWYHVANYPSPPEAPELNCCGC